MENITNLEEDKIKGKERSKLKLGHQAKEQAYSPNFQPGIFVPN